MLFNHNPFGPHGIPYAAAMALHELKKPRQGELRGDLWYGEIYDEIYDESYGGVSYGE